MKDTRKQDRLTAIAVFVISLIVTSYAYATLIREQRAISSLVHKLQPGHSSYIISSAEKCAGNFSLDFTPAREKSVLKVKGSLNVKLTEKTLLLPFSFEAVFNALGQLGGSILRVSIANIEIRAGTSEINPIKFSLSVSSDRANIRKEVVAPGPIELASEGPGSYSIRYSQLKLPAYMLEQVERQPLIKSLKIKVYRSNKNHLDCNKYTGAIDISWLNNSYNQLSNLGLHKVIQLMLNNSK
ncbi:MAG: hypothetical protein D6719_02750 [Candidatus Dadabacteria bacterium]|nr:MAG: hypothetical protein D6719_02750 [Candidatus Dadabacteria bacterium]